MKLTQDEALATMRMIAAMRGGMVARLARLRGGNDTGRLVGYAVGVWGNWGRSEARWLWLADDGSLACRSLGSLPGMVVAIALDRGK